MADRVASLGVPLTTLFGRVVAGLRQEAKLSQGALADRLAWERTLLGRVETGRNTATVDNIFELDAFFVEAGLLDRRGDLWALFTRAAQTVTRRGMVVLVDRDAPPDGVDVADSRDLDRIVRRVVEDWLDDRSARTVADRRAVGGAPARDRSADREDDWIATAVSGEARAAGTGATSAWIRLQHDFRASDITFTGTSPGATITSLYFGDRLVWSNPDGIPVDVLTATGVLRGLVEGQRIAAGLDVVANGVVTKGGAVVATVMGTKPLLPGE